MVFHEDEFGILPAHFDDGFDMGVKVGDGGGLGHDLVDIGSAHNLLSQFSTGAGEAYMA